jgi:hypothetical protein
VRGARRPKAARWARSCSWLCQTQEPAGADWPDVERMQRLERLLSRLGEWLRIVVRYCGRDDHLRVLTTDPFKPLISRDGIELGVVHLNLVAAPATVIWSCSTTGGTAGMQSSVVTGPPCPSDYMDRVRESLEPRAWSCGSSDFECLVWYCYDTDANDLGNVPLDQWDDAFGAFGAWVIVAAAGWRSRSQTRKRREAAPSDQVSHWEVRDAAHRIERRFKFGNFVRWAGRPSC